MENNLATSSKQFQKVSGPWNAQIQNATFFPNFTDTAILQVLYHYDW